MVNAADKKANEWVDAQRQPGDAEGDAGYQAALARRISTHEFLMTGGIVVGTENGKVVYSEAIKLPLTGEFVKFQEVCPWHGEECSAWLAIVAGDGVWTKLERELALVEDALGDKNLTDEEKEPEWDRYNAIRKELGNRPRDLGKLRAMTDEQIRANRQAAKLERLGKSGTAPKPAAKPAAKKGPFPWSTTGNHDGVTAKAVHIDARNDADVAFSDAGLPDTIEIEGDEDE